MLKVQFVQGAVCIENVIVQVNHSYCIESEKNIVVDALIKSVVSAVVLRTSKPLQDAQVSQCQQHNKTCTESCSSYYNDCYQNCGGVVNVYEKK